MSTTTRLITADELLVMPHRDEHGNDCRLELIRGEVKKSPLNGAIHGLVCAKLTAALAGFIKLKALGVGFGTGTGFVVERDPDTVLGVDAAFVSHERLRAVEDHEGFVPFAPDLAIEVIGPDDTV